MSQEHCSQLLTEQEVADRIRMSVAFLRRDRVEGKRSGRTQGPPFVRIGRSIRFRPSDVDRWVEAHLERQDNS